MRFTRLVSLLEPKYFEAKMFRSWRRVQLWKFGTKRVEVAQEPKAYWDPTPSWPPGRAFPSHRLYRIRQLPDRYRRHSFVCFDHRVVQKSPRSATKALDGRATEASSQ